MENQWAIAFWLIISIFIILGLAILIEYLDKSEE